MFYFNCLICVNWFITLRLKKLVVISVNSIILIYIINKCENVKMWKKEGIYKYKFKLLKI